MSCLAAHSICQSGIAARCTAPSLNSELLLLALLQRRRALSYPHTARRLTPKAVAKGVWRRDPRRVQLSRIAPPPVS